MKKAKLDENVKKLNIQHVQIIALWMCMLMITLPMYSANAMAVVTFDEVRVTGGDGIEDFRKDIDTTTVNVKLTSDSQVLATYLELMNDTPGTDRATAVKFQQCSPSGPQYDCSVTLPASDVSDNDKYNICINVANVEGRGNFPQTCRDARPVAQQDGNTFSAFKSVLIDRAGPQITSLTTTNTAVSVEPVDATVQVTDTSGTSAAGCVGVKSINLLQLSTAEDGTVSAAPVDQFTVNQEPATEGACVVDHTFTIETAALPNGEATTLCVLADDHFGNKHAAYEDENGPVVSNTNCFAITKDNRPPEIQQFGVNTTVGNTELAHVPARIIDVTITAQILTHTHGIGEVKANVASFARGDEDVTLTCTDNTQLLGEEAGNDHLYVCTKQVQLDPSGDQTRSLTLNVKDAGDNEQAAATSISFQLDDLSPNVLSITTPAVYNGIPVIGPGQKTVIAQIGETGAGVTGDTIKINNKATECAAVEQGVFHCALNTVTAPAGAEKVGIKVTGHDLADNALALFEDVVDVDVTPPQIVKAQLVSQTGAPNLVAGGTVILRLIVRENFAMSTADGQNKVKAQLNFDVGTPDSEFRPPVSCQPFTGPAPVAPVDAQAQLEAAAQQPADVANAPPAVVGQPGAAAPTPAPASPPATPPAEEPAADAEPAALTAEPEPEVRTFGLYDSMGSDGTPQITLVPLRGPVYVGDTVAWSNKGQQAHTVDATDRSFQSGAIAPGSEYTHVFNTPGTVNFMVDQQIPGSLEVLARPDGITGNIVAVTGMASQDTKDLWQCDWEVTNVKKPGKLQATFTGSTDIAGNKLVDANGNSQQLNVNDFYMVYTDRLGNEHEIHPSDWQSGVAQEGLTPSEYAITAIMTSPVVDAKGLEVRSLPVFFELDIEAEETGYEPASVDVASCSGADFEGGLFDQTKTKIMFSTRNTDTAHLRFGLRPGKVPETQNKLEFQCEILVVSKRGNSISAPSKTMVDFTIPLGNVQSISDSIWDTIIHEMDEGVHMADWVPKADKVFNFLNSICTILNTLSAISAAIAAIQAGMTVLANAWPFLKPASQALTKVSSTINEFTGGFEKSIAGSACNFLTCTWTPGQEILKALGIKMTSLEDTLGDLAKEANSLDPDKKFKFNFQAWANPKSSLWLSYASLCLPGIISNWQRRRVIQCQYIDCLYSQVGAGMPKITCDKVYHYEKCKIEVGEWFYIIPFAHVHKQLASTLKGLLESPATVFILSGAVYCNYFAEDNALAACNVLWIPFQVTRVINSVKAIIDTVKGMFDMPPDMCEGVFKKIKDDPRYDQALERQEKHGTVDDIIAGRTDTAVRISQGSVDPQVGAQDEEVDVFN